MAGTIIHLEKYVKGFENKQFHIEMDNVASGNDNYPVSKQQQQQQPCHQSDKYVQSAPPTDAWGSDASLDSRYPEQRADVQPLTESHLCRYEECQKFHAVGAGDPESPESPIKNYLLYLVLVMFLVWILVYAILNRLSYL